MPLIQNPNTSTADNSAPSQFGPVCDEGGQAPWESILTLPLKLIYNSIRSIPTQETTVAWSITIRSAFPYYARHEYRRRMLACATSTKNLVLGTPNDCFRVTAPHMIYEPISNQIAAMTFTQIIYRNTNIHFFISVRIFLHILSMLLLQGII